MSAARRERRLVARAVRQFARRMMRTAGIDPEGHHQLQLGATPHKVDDARWFADHPQRAHRLRPRWPGENDLGNAAGAEIDLVLIRQAMPGARIRQPLRWRACEPDFFGFMAELLVQCETNEAIAHALFDLPRGDGDTLMSIDEIRAALDRYRQSKARQ